MNAVDLHTSNRVVGSYYDWNDWRQLEHDVNGMTRWQLDQLCERMGWPARFDRPDRLLNALRAEPWNTVRAAIETVQDRYN